MQVIVVVEGIYSMEGEMALLRRIVEVKKKYKAYLYLDEVGVFATCVSASRLCRMAGCKAVDVVFRGCCWVRCFVKEGMQSAGISASELRS